MMILSAFLTVGSLLRSSIELTGPTTPVLPVVYSPTELVELPLAELSVLPIVELSSPIVVTTEEDPAANTTIHQDTVTVTIDTTMACAQDDISCNAGLLFTAIKLKSRHQLGRVQCKLQRSFVSLRDMLRSAFSMVQYRAETRSKQSCFLISSPSRMYFDDSCTFLIGVFGLTAESQVPPSVPSSPQRHTEQSRSKSVPTSILIGRFMADNRVLVSVSAGLIAVMLILLYECIQQHRANRRDSGLIVDDIPQYDYDIEWRAFLCFIKGAEIKQSTLSPVDFFTYLSATAYDLLPWDTEFVIIQDYFDFSTPETRNIYVVFAVFDVALRRLPNRSREEQAACKRLWKLLHIALEAIVNGPTKPERDWASFHELVQFAKRQQTDQNPIKFGALAKLFFYCVPKEYPLANSFRHTFNGSDAKHKYRKLNLAFHPDKTVSISNKMHKALCDDACMLVIDAYGAYKARQNARRSLS